MRVINKGASPLEFVDPNFEQKDGKPVPSSAKIPIGIGDDVPLDLWNALDQEKRDFLQKTGSVEVIGDTEKPKPAPAKTPKSA